MTTQGPAPSAMTPPPIKPRAPWPWVTSIGLHALLLLIGPCAPEAPRIAIERVELVLMMDDAQADLLARTTMETTQSTGEHESASSVMDGEGSPLPADATDPRADADAWPRGAKEDTQAPVLQPAAGEPEHAVASRHERSESPADIEDVDERGEVEEPPEVIPQPTPTERRYLHAPESQEAGVADADAAISDADRATDELTATSVQALTEGAISVQSEQGATPSPRPVPRASRAEEPGQQSEQQESGGRGERAEDRATAGGEDGASPVAPNSGEGPTDIPEPIVNEAVDVSPEDPSTAEDAVAEAIARPHWMDGLPEAGDLAQEEIDTIEAPTWWEATAQRPIAAPGRAGASATPSPATATAQVAKAAPPPKAEDHDTDAPPPAEGTADQTAEHHTVDQAMEPGTGDAEDRLDEGEMGDGKAADSEQREAPITEVFRQDMGWQAPSAPGTDLLSAQPASEQVVLTDQVEALAARVETRKTPEGVYAAHVERVLAEAWFDKAPRVETRITADRREVTVLFRIRRSGRVTDLVLTRSSGDAHIDHLALISVPKRFVRFSSDIEAKFLLFEWTFHYRD